MFLEKQRNQFRWKSQSSLLILSVVGGLIGCGHFQVSTSIARPPYAHKLDDFLPLNGGQTAADFTVDGTKTNYQLKTNTKDSTVSFQAISDGTLIDEEVYEVKDQAVYLRRAAGENFEPAVMLIKFPLSVGDKYEWKGKLACDLEKIDGNATVLTSTDFVRLKDKSQDAIKVEMNLTFGKGASRKLSFWFVKGKGVLRTEMFKNIREPRL